MRRRERTGRGGEARRLKRGHLTAKSGERVGLMLMGQQGGGGKRCIEGVL